MKKESQENQKLPQRDQINEDKIHFPKSSEVEVQDKKPKYRNKIREKESTLKERNAVKNTIRNNVEEMQKIMNLQLKIAQKDGIINEFQIQEDEDLGYKSLVISATLTAKHAADRSTLRSYLGLRYFDNKGNANVSCRTKPNNDFKATVIPTQEVFRIISDKIKNMEPDEMTLIINHANRIQNEATRHCAPTPIQTQEAFRDLLAQQLDKSVNQDEVIKYGISRNDDNSLELSIQYTNNNHAIGAFECLTLPQLGITSKVLPDGVTCSTKEISQNCYVVTMKIACTPDIIQTLTSAINKRKMQDEQLHSLARNVKIIAQNGTEQKDATSRAQLLHLNEQAEQFQMQQQLLQRTIQPVTQFQQNNHKTPHIPLHQAALYHHYNIGQNQLFVQPINQNYNNDQNICDQQMPRPQFGKTSFPNNVQDFKLPEQKPHGILFNNLKNTDPQVAQISVNVVPYKSRHYNQKIEEVLMTTPEWQEGSFGAKTINHKSNDVIDTDDAEKITKKIKLNNTTLQAYQKYHTINYSKPGRPKGAYARPRGIYKTKIKELQQDLNNDAMSHKSDSSVGK